MQVLTRAVKNWLSQAPPRSSRLMFYCISQASAKSSRDLRTRVSVVLPPVLPGSPWRRRPFLSAGKSAAVMTPSAIGQQSIMVKGESLGEKGLLKAVTTGASLVAMARQFKPGTTAYLFGLLHRYWCRSCPICFSSLRSDPAALKIQFLLSTSGYTLSGLEAPSAKEKGLLLNMRSLFKQVSCPVSTSA